MFAFKQFVLYNGVFNVKDISYIVIRFIWFPSFEFVLHVFAFVSDRIYENVYILHVALFVISVREDTVK